MGYCPFEDYFDRHGFEPCSEFRNGRDFQGDRAYNILASYRVVHDDCVLFPGAEGRDQNHRPTVLQKMNLSRIEKK